jgi:hypothetical protein
MSLHMMAAAKFEEPLLMLQPDEAKKIGDAIDKVQSMYPINVDPKAIAWGQLVIVLASVYGPRAMIIYQKQKQLKNRGM